MRKPVLLDQIKITLSPKCFGESQDIELQLTVRSMGEESHIREILRADDLESTFDRYFDRMKEMLKAEMLRHHAIINDVMLEPNMKRCIADARKAGAIL